MRLIILAVEFVHWLLTLSTLNSIAVEIHFEVQSVPKVEPTSVGMNMCGDAGLITSTLSQIVAAEEQFTSCSSMGVHDSQLDGAIKLLHLNEQTESFLKIYHGNSREY